MAGITRRGNIGGSSSKRSAPVVADGVRLSDYSAPAKDEPLEDWRGYRLVRCNNCMTIFNERDTSDGPMGDVCTFCGSDGELMDMTMWDIFDGPYAIMKRPATSWSVPGKSKAKAPARKPSTRRR